MSEKKITDFKAIATTYRNFQFRSRLEAKWAVFFDHCGWKWSYEPLDLNGWIPDFAIGERPTLVEIKPYFNEAEWSDAKAKIIESGYSKPVILLGVDATFLNITGEAPQVGWLYEPMAHDGRTEWATWDLHFGVTEGNGKFGLCPLDGGWWNCIWKPPANATSANKWSRVWLEAADVEENLVSRWAHACNVSKWIPTR